MDIWNLVFIAILIALTAFFVASEFAIVKIRSSRIDQLLEEGNKKAISTKKIITNLDEYLSACQLGITMTALALGWIGEETFATIISPVISFLTLPDAVAKTLTIILSFMLITFIHVVIGELAPKTVAIQKAESIALLTSKPLMTFYKIMYPFIWALNGSARLIAKSVGVEPASKYEIAHTEEELQIILSESLKSGEINQSEFKYVNNIFEFDNRIAKEIMVPRTEMISLSKDDLVKEFIDVFHAEKFTRYPIIDGDKDHIIGLVNVKEILTDIVQHKQVTTVTLDPYIRPIIRVLDTMPIHDLLVKMQTERIHMAVLMDEYGGTSGLVTIEDIVEEIVGEIRDEFDADEIPEIRKNPDGSYIVDSKVLISEINDLLGTNLDDSDIDTIGGWVLTENYDAKLGDTIDLEGYEVTIIDMEDHHIHYVEIKQKVKEYQIIGIPQKNVAEEDNVLFS
ncbi:HlyC/CorC family transporter [Pradoshia sp. D12]|uniref:hemolysin family protein n=1 Tax=Bacillaceae TaxID=186817 RepID=UPI000980C0E0|nr:MULTISPECIES: hemolysin family protein [Bacillaceae]QFK70456.1 HlyC/CorC family transporter [Pradoshia sp. D12]TPF72251.1 HlyC/CorC family transporter [Bacillus sp. D12]